MLTNIEITKEANKLQNQIVYHIISRAIILACETNLAKYLLEGPVKIDILAHKLGYHPETALRFFRLLESLHLLAISDEKIITSTYLTSCISQVNSEHYFGSFAAFNFFQHSLKENRECWSDAFGESFYGHLEKNPKKLNEFQSYLEETAENWLGFIPDIFNFSQYNTLVDVGGGNGQLLAKILHNSPSVGILFEKPEVIQKASQYLKSKELLSRISLVPGDFFSEDLPEGDIYILCRVLLNWNDENAIKIINNCLKKRKENRKTIIIDFVVPDKEHKYYQRSLLHDLNLLAVFGGRIRNLLDWKSLVNHSQGKLVNYKIIDEDISPTLNVPMIVMEVE